VRDDTAKLLLGRNDAGQPDDLPRNAEGIALIGDPRNDVHLFVAQLHVAMLKLHNLLVDGLREDGVPDAELFEEARRATTWHYQWI
jgi:Animal haem peroxidase